MTPQSLPSLPSRRLRLAAAGLGGILIGLLVMRLLSGDGDGDDIAVGRGPQATRVPAQTTTTLTLLPALNPDAAPVQVNPRDPFGQIVTAPEAPQASQATQQSPVIGAQGTQSTQATPRSSTSTSRPPPTTTTTGRLAQGVPPPSATPAASTPLPAMTPNLVWGTVGPVTVPAVPVNVCVIHGTTSCTSTVPATSVTLTAAATIDPAAVTSPTILPVACSNGGGAAFHVNTGSAATVIYVSVAVMVNGGPTNVGLSIPVTTPNQSVILSACVTPGVGVVSAAAPVPPPPAPPSGLVGGLLPSLLGLLGGAPAPGAPGTAPTLAGLLS